MTKYLVLHKPDIKAVAGNPGARPLQGWVEYRRDVEASSSDAAVRNSIEEGAGSGQYVAVPMRSWQPLEVTIESRPSYAIGKPSA